MDLGNFSFIAHEGKAHDENPPGRGSGRYPFGSGNRPHQHDWDIMARYDKLVATNPNLSAPEIAAEMGYYKYDKYGKIVLDDNGNPKGSKVHLDAAIKKSRDATRQDEYQEALWYKEAIDPDTGKHYTNDKIAKLMGKKGESSIRTILTTGANGNINKTSEIADKLRKEADSKGIIDVSSSVEHYIGCSQNSLKAAIELLREEGYTTTSFALKQVANRNLETTISVLAKPGEDTKNLFRHPDRVKQISDVEETFDNDIQNPATRTGCNISPMVSLDRIKIRYGDEGGTDRDGLIEIKAVRDENGNLTAASPDLSLGNARYAQIRIAVEGNRYIKGMAVYNENLEKDILVHSNKPSSKGVDGALKELKMNKDGTLADNPFGSSVVNCQSVMRDRFGKPILDKDGNEVMSAINFVGANKEDAHIEGRWGKWSKNLPAQFLTDLPYNVIKNQLQLQTKIYEDNLKEIQSLNNPTVKRNLLIGYGDQLDAASCELKGAPIGGQKTRVFLPVPSLKNNEVYAPGLDNGTTVAVARFPHQGKWEIVIAKVNNNNQEGKAMFGDGADAIGLNHYNHGKLSGADSDGDTGIVIPMTRKNKTTGEFDKVLEVYNMESPQATIYTDNNGGSYYVSLAEFDTSAAYGLENPRFKDMYKTVTKNGKETHEPTYPYFKTEKAKGKEMGIVSNLLQDMRLKGCEDIDELVRADMYSMVVIDAKKHKLNWKQAREDYKIQELVDKYQRKKKILPNGEEIEVVGGASTLITQASSPSQQSLRGVWKGTEKGAIDPETGKKVYKEPFKKTETKAIGPEYVKIPDSNRYLKDADGNKIQATWDGKVVKNEDGTYSYDPGSGKGKWRYKETERQENIKKMLLVDDANQLLSANPSKIELLYADYANHCKKLANDARKLSLNETPLEYNKEANKKYAKEVQELNEALVRAEKNAPRERAAQMLCTSNYNAILNEMADTLDSEDKRKLRGQCLSSARDRCNANKDRIKFTEQQWEAINAGAVHQTTLDKLLRNADKDNYMQLALPKESRISESTKSNVLAAYAQGLTYEQVAEKYGISTGSVANIINA